MPTYYVSPTGNNSNDGLDYDNDHAWETITYSLTQIMAGDTIKILPGTYSEALSTSIAGSDGSWITLEAYDYDNKPLISSTGSPIFSINHEYYKLLGLKGTGNHRGIQIQADNILVSQNEVWEVTYGIYLNSADSNNVIIQRSKFTDTSHRTVYCATGGIRLYYNVIQGFKPNSRSNSVQIFLNGVGTSYLYNNTVIGGLGTPIYANGATVVATLKNNIIAHYGIGNWNAYGLQVVNGATVTYSNNLITCNMQNINRTVSGGIDGGNNLIGSQYLPKFIAYRSVGKFLITVDDLLDSAEVAAGIADTYSLKTTGCLYWVDNVDEENLNSRVQSLINAGHDIANHSRSHNGLTNTYNGTIRYDGADNNPVINIDHTTHTITLSTDENNDDVVVTGIDTKTIAELEFAIDGENWSYTKGSTQKSTVFLTALADTGGDASLSGSPPELNLDYNISQFFDDEIDWTKDWMESIAPDGFVQYGLSYPFWSVNDSVIDGVKGAGLLAARVGTSIGYDLRSLIIYKIVSANWAGTYGDGSETALTNMYSQLATTLACGPYVIAATFHEIDTTPTPEQLGYICNALASNLDYIDIVTIGGLGNDVQNSGNWVDADGDQERWTRTFIDNSNYGLESDSPCRNVGEDLGFTEDILGVSVPQETNPSIGAYEWESSVTTTTTTTTTSSTTSSSTTTTTVSTTSTTTTTTSPRMEVIDLDSEITKVVDLDSEVTNEIDLDSEIT